MRLPKLQIFDLLYRAYHAWPTIYDGVTQLVSIGQWERWQDRVFDDLSGKKILEIGVGPGRLLIRMAKKGFRVTGLELRKGMEYEARKRVKQAGFDVDILHQSVYDLPFKDETFDAIVMTFVLAEIDDLDKAIKEMKRVIRRNGKIIIIAGGMPQDENLIAKLLFKLIGFQTTLRLERNNQKEFEKWGFQTTRTDFGPFNIVHKIVAIKN
jgi:ubiquinone/menaquinone biosynthesis C-methylase UbiE